MAINIKHLEMEKFKRTLFLSVLEITPKRSFMDIFMDIISIQFLPHIFSLQLNLTYMKLILQLVPAKMIILKSIYNWGIFSAKGGGGYQLNFANKTGLFNPI